MSAVLDLFLELAAILSPPGEERAVADRVLERLRAAGLQPDEDAAGTAIGMTPVGGARADPALQVVVAVLEGALEAAGLEEVADAEQQLDAVQRLGDEVLGAQAERAAARRRGVVAGQDQRGHADLDDLLEQLEAVGAGQLGAGELESSDRQVQLRVRELAHGVERRERICHYLGATSGHYSAAPSGT